MFVQVSVMAAIVGAVLADVGIVVVVIFAIARYPDVMVHRVLDALLTGSDDGFQRNDDAHEQAGRGGSRVRGPVTLLLGWPEDLSHPLSCAAWHFMQLLYACLVSVSFR